ncbi:uncharacterized protein LOC100880714 [Megachile rotundata]|uniref:uncharacterized protein LOC100880714 n=1 Tax=Megachile rotundata TaxID=143995 RepID=UPI000614DDAD|nr:PREDICTED: CDGSH iron-sulfur domain-containing protein 3, mitochondrial [Megachile rotundata]
MLTMAVKLNRISPFACCNILNYQNVRWYCTKKESDMQIPKNPLKKYFSASDQPTNGVIFDNKPFKYTCIAGKKYVWCLCGKSHSQPFCDGTHRNQALKIKLRPIVFTVEETKDYWLCNCKQTSNRPFCDGTHLREDIKKLKYRN